MENGPPNSGTNESSGSSASRANSDAIVLRSYQEDAVQSWIENDRRGIFEMATGTGKTFTAIGALDRVLESSSGPLFVVISVPYTHLVSQWDFSLSEWGFDKTWNLYGTDNPSWREDLSRLVSDLLIGVRDSVIALTTHATFANEDFRSLIEGADCQTMVIADEVHGLGSEQHRSGLSEVYDWRLGLSATPERYYDETGTDYLLEYFDGVVFSYTLADAIPEYLTPYEYQPTIVELTDEELSAYQKISTKMARELNKETPDEERLKQLTMKRARIIKSAAGKVQALEGLLDSMEDHSHLLVYTNSQQIEDVQEALNEFGIIHHKFTYHEDADQRAELLDGFERGAYEALVAMRCLDEGVDVPATKQAILMSNSSNPMQFIQRRGRVLRRANELGKEKAIIYDLIVVPSTDPDKVLRGSEQGILENELRRFLEFANDASNGTEAKNRIYPICVAYDIDMNELREDSNNA